VPPPVIDEIQHLEQEFKREEGREKAFREDVLRGIHRLESKVGILQKQVPTKAKAAWHDLTLRIVRVFSFAFIASFIPLVSGLGAFPNMSTVRAAAWAAVVAGMAAVLKVMQASVTKDEEPFLDKGIFGEKTS